MKTFAILMTFAVLLVSAQLAEPGKMLKFGQPKSGD